MAETAAGPLVLVVDDSATSRLMIKTRLSMRGFAVAEAATGAEALAAVKAQQPGLVLLDFFLPDMNGRQVLQALKQDPTTHAVPVVIVSGNDAEEDMRACRALGAGFLLKPYEPEQLIERVQAAFGA